MNLPPFGLAHPVVLWAWLLLPLFAVWLLWAQRGYWTDAFRFSRVSVMAQLADRPALVWQQRLLPGLLLSAMATLIFALAGPYTVGQIPTRHSDLMLLLDISISMEADDLKPERLSAAKTAAIRFIDGLPEDVRVGLAFFAGNNYVAAPPTLEHRQLTRLLQGLSRQDLRPGTAIGEAIMTGIDTLQPPGAVVRNPGRGAGGTLILVTDGENNLGISPTDASDAARQHHIVVHTIGIGGEAGAYVRNGVYTSLDEPALQDIANQTGGVYFRARSARDFGAIYRNITAKTVTMETRRINQSAWFEALACLFLLGALGWIAQRRRFTG